MSRLRDLRFLLAGYLPALVGAIVQVRDFANWRIVGQEPPVLVIFTHCHASPPPPAVLVTALNNPFVTVTIHAMAGKYRDLSPDHPDR
jgi:hypothetical protein